MISEGNIVVAELPQSDGSSKLRPVLLLRKLPGFGDFLSCGISTQLRQAELDFDVILAKDREYFETTGLRASSVVRLNFLASVPQNPMRRHLGELPLDLLETLRATKRAVPTVVVDARWVLLDSESLDPVTLEELTGAASGARGRIACTSGQLVHLAAGERRVVATGAVPVVGGGIGYQPEIATANVGIVLEVRPTVAHDRKTAVLDVRNIVTQWRKPGTPIKVDGDATARVDRVVMPTQQFAATMRVPIGRPVLIGGITLAPTDGQSKELYLVIQTSIAQ
jgi:mRNA interferase MazF